MPVLMIIIASFLVLLLVAAFYFAHIIIHPKQKSHAGVYQREVDYEVIDPVALATYAREEINLPSPNGYALHGLFFPCPGAKKAVVVVHGITCNLWGSVKYMNIFRQLGYHALIYDHRNHGKSGGSNTTFGFYEKEDLKAVITWLENKIGADAWIGVHGESMGTAISLLTAAEDARIRFVVADCGYAGLEEQLAYRLKVEYHLPGFPLLNLAKLFARLLTGMQFKQLNPIDAVAKISVPILFIHGEQDAYIPPECARRMADIPRQAKTSLYIAPQADHAESLWKNPVAYPQAVFEFLEGIEPDA